MFRLGEMSLGNQGDDSNHVGLSWRDWKAGSHAINPPWKLWCGLQIVSVEGKFSLVVEFQIRESGATWVGQTPLWNARHSRYNLAWKARRFLTLVKLNFKNSVPFKECRRNTFHLLQWRKRHDWRPVHMKYSVPRTRLWICRKCDLEIFVREL